MGNNINFFHDYCMVKTTTKGQNVTFCYNQVGSLYSIGEGVSPTQVNSMLAITLVPKSLNGTTIWVTYTFTPCMK
jgi:hypothetical protein